MVNYWQIITLSLVLKWPWEGDFMALKLIYHPFFSCIQKQNQFILYCPLQLNDPCPLHYWNSKYALKSLKQGSRNKVYEQGIYRDETMADKLMYIPMMIHKIISSVDYN